MKLRLMTNNQWKNDCNRPAWEAMGVDCSAAARMGGFARVFAQLMPDVVGLQELSPLMLSLLWEELESLGLKYTVIWGADTPIAYRCDRLELLETQFAYHSEHIPDLEGCFNNGRTKSYTIARFREKREGRQFVFANTHLWWKSSDPLNKNYQPFSDEARVYQLREVMAAAEAMAKAQGCAVVAVGDLNADYDSPALKSAFERGYVHAHDVATDYRDETNGTHFCFAEGYRDYEPTAFKQGIDHILIKGDVAVSRFERYYPGWYMPLSDHFPAYADVEFN